MAGGKGGDVVFWGNAPGGAGGVFGINSGQGGSGRRSTGSPDGIADGSGGGGGAAGGIRGFGGTADFSGGGYGGDGGNGGAHGFQGAFQAGLNAADLSGTTGQAGGVQNFVYGGSGGGGEGGFGAVLTAGGENSLVSHILGGQGGAGGGRAGFNNNDGNGLVGYGEGGGGGDGGIGIWLTGSIDFANFGIISGGTGGSGGIAAVADTSRNGKGGNGGDGIVGSGVTIVNAGTIAGGLQGANGNGLGQAAIGTPQDGNAVTFIGGTNSLELRAGSTIMGNVVGNGTADTLKLGGTTAASFDISTIGDTAQYRGFEAFAKTGPGTWTLTGASTTERSWTVDEGSLHVETSASLWASTATISVKSTGTLTGSGEFGGSVLVESGGTLRPGPTVGSFTTGSVTLMSGALYQQDYGADVTQFKVNGTVTLGGATLVLPASATPIASAYTIIDNDGSNDAVVGMFDGLAQGATVTLGTKTFYLRYDGGDGNDVTLSTTPLPPSAPDLDAASDLGFSSSDNITTVTAPKFTGTAESGATVTLYDTDSTTVLGTGIATGGNWSITSSALSFRQPYSHRHGN
jgi:hypothetical protein